MHHKNLFLTGIVLSSLVLGCAKSDNDQNGDPKAGSQELDLSDKSFEEILKIKYDKAELSCSLWVQRNEKLDLTIAPNDSFVLDIKADPKIPQAFKMIGQVQNHKVEVSIAVNSLAIWRDLHYTDSEGNIYLAQYSPHADYVLTFTSQTIFENGLVTTGSFQHERQIYEKIPSVAVNESHDSYPSEQAGVIINYGAYRTYLQCLIETDIKPPYQNQFEVQPKKN